MGSDLMKDHVTEPIRFVFDERKATDAAAYLLKLHGGAMSHLRLIKLLYVAERESLARYGRPIMGDRYVAMKHGPVPSGIYDLIEERRTGCWWHELIDRQGYDVRLKADSDHGSLSEADLEILEEVAKLYRTFNQFHLRDMTHEEFEEWEDPGDTSKDIPTERILRVLGKSDAEIEGVRQASKEKQFFDALFGSA